MPRCNTERAESLWRSMIDGMRGEISSIVIDTYMELARGIDITSDRFVLCCDNVVARDWIARNQRINIEKMLEEETGTQITLELLAGEDEAKAYITERERPEKNFVGSEYTFENFVVGSSNRFAHAAAQAVASGNGKNYNPLFIYGGSGLGKTHLLYAIANEFRRQFPNKRVTYVRGEDFTNELIEAIREGRLRAGREREFREKYRTSDLFLVDDIQFIAGKEATQEEFFNTFNTLYEAGKQIVLTSDRPPKDMARLEERLRTRFESSVPCDVQPPELETRVGIVRNKARAVGMEMSDAVALYVAENITYNVRQVEGVVKKLGAYAALLREPITVAAAQQAMGDVLTEKSDPTAEDIIEEIERFYDLDRGALCGKRRDAHTARARQIAGYLLRTMTRLSFPEIGRALGRHHSTIMYSVDQIADDRRTDRKLDADLKDLTMNITNRR